MGTALADVLYAMRRFGRASGFTAVAIVTLALGIGANATLFLLVNAALRRLIPVERPILLGIEHRHCWWQVRLHDSLENCEISGFLLRPVDSRRG